MELRKQKVYKRVFDLACENLLNSDIPERLERGLIAYQEEENGIAAEIPFFDEIITLNLPGFTFRSSQKSSVNLVTKIVILHYILNAAGKPLSPVSERLPYEDIPGCMHYLPVFERRALKPIQTAFGHDRHLFKEAGMTLDGVEESFGDASFTLYALPMVPITIILWEADEEFPASARMLFDPSISAYLPLEDIVVVAKLAATRTIHAGRQEDRGNDT